MQARAGDRIVTSPARCVTPCAKTAVDGARGGATIATNYRQGNCAMADLDQDGTIFVGKGSKPEVLTLALANRHGLVAGATGTGKTVTLQVLAEGLSRAGVSVFAADVKGDLSGISEPGEAKEIPDRSVSGRVLGLVRGAR